MTPVKFRQSFPSHRICHALTALACLISASFSLTSDSEEFLHWKDTWVRSMPPGAQVSAAYGMLMNHSDTTVTLSTVSSDISGAAEIHEVIADGGQRRMVRLTSIDIAPHETLVLESGSRHIMLLDIAAPPVEGDFVEICAITAAGTRACNQAPVKRQNTAQQDIYTNHH